MNEPRRIEREFGIPFAGDILGANKWTQTALKAFPQDGPLSWVTLFGRSAPVMLDLGCGNGRSTLASAVSRRDFDHLGIDALPVVIRYARRRGNQRGLTNLKFAVGGAFDLVANYVTAGSVREIHCYHPQPFYDPSKVHLRLITPNFLAKVHLALEPGGSFVIQTDNPGYWRYIQQLMPTFFEFHERIGRWPDATRGRTRREIIAMRKGLPVFRGWGIARTDLAREEAVRLAESLPAPRFDADRRLRDLDRFG